jgi:hypothetical protein
MPADVCGDERAERHQLESTSAQVVERAGDEAGAKAAPLERRIDVGVNDDDSARLGAVDNESRQCRPVPELVTQLLGIVYDADILAAFQACSLRGLARTGARATWSTEEAGLLPHA